MPLSPLLELTLVVSVILDSKQALNQVPHERPRPMRANLLLFVRRMRTGTGCLGLRTGVAAPHWGGVVCLFGDRVDGVTDRTKSRIVAFKCSGSKVQTFTISCNSLGQSLTLDDNDGLPHLQPGLQPGFSI